MTVPGDTSFADQAFAVSADAYARAEGAWELSVHAAIAALFDFLSERPAQTAGCFLGDHAASPDALAHRDETIDRFLELLRPGFATPAASPHPVVADAIGGGIYELVRSHVLERRLEELPDAAANATIVALSPFIGADSAIELAGSPGA